MIHCNSCNTDKDESEFYHRKCGKIIKPCKECTKTRVKNNSSLKTTEDKREKWNEWSQNNREHLKEYSRKYRVENKEIVQKIAERYRESKKDDISYQISSKLRKKLIYYVITKPSDKKLKLFGANSAFIRSWIEYQFTDNMNWDNYGDVWNFDHINPYDNYDLTKEEDILQCCHWSNIQPLLSSENSGKKNKVDTELISKKKELATKFEQEF